MHNLSLSARWNRRREADAGFATFQRSLHVVNEELVCLVNQDDRVVISLCCGLLDTNDQLQFGPLLLEEQLDLGPRLGVLVSEYLIRPHNYDSMSFLVFP